jgi:vacuolar-type H+-ATPase subunit F/Vma7
MSRIVAMGEAEDVKAFAMVGVDVVEVSDAASLSRTWAGLRDDIGLVILTRSAAEMLGRTLHEPGHPLWAVMP